MWFPDLFGDGTPPKKPHLDRDRSLSRVSFYKVKIRNTAERQKQQQMWYFDNFMVAKLFILPVHVRRREKITKILRSLGSQKQILIPFNLSSTHDSMNLQRKTFF